MEEIAHSEDHVWNSKETAGTGQAWYRQAEQVCSEAKPDRICRTAELNSEVASLPKEAQPEFIPPQLAQQAETPPANAGWVHELKLDGYRIQARKSGPKVQLLTRKGLDWTHRMRGIAEAVARIPAASATIDGEVVVLRDDGNTSFADLQASFQEGARHTLTYFCFDLLHLNGHNTRDLPLIDRKNLLEQLVTGADPETMRLSEHLASDGEKIFRSACEMHAEGIISKLGSSKYSSGRSAALDQVQVPARAGICNRRIHSSRCRPHGYVRNRVAGAGLLQRRQAHLRWTNWHRLQSENPQDASRQAGEAEAVDYAISQSPFRGPKGCSLGEAGAGCSGEICNLDCGQPDPAGCFPGLTGRQAGGGGHARNFGAEAKVSDGRATGRAGEANIRREASDCKSDELKKERGIRDSRTGSPHPSG